MSCVATESIITHKQHQRRVAIKPSDRGLPQMFNKDDSGNDELGCWKGKYLTPEAFPSVMSEGPFTTVFQNYGDRSFLLIGEEAELTSPICQDSEN